MSNKGDARRLVRWGHLFFANSVDRKEAPTIERLGREGKKRRNNTKAFDLPLDWGDM
jgi:hypothetical protein